MAIFRGRKSALEAGVWLLRGLSYDPGSRPDQGPVTLPSHQPPWLVIGTAAIFLAAKRSFFERVPFFRFDAQSYSTGRGRVDAPEAPCNGVQGSTRVVDQRYDDRPGWQNTYRCFSYLTPNQQAYTVVN